MGDIANKSGLKQISPTREVISGKLVDSVKSHLRHLAPGRQLPPVEAARILNIPESHLESLLEEKRIPFVLNGNGRKIRYRDVMNYKASRDRQRQEGLVQLAAMTQECNSR